MKGVITPKHAWLVDRPDGIVELMLEGTCAGVNMVACVGTTRPHADVVHTAEALAQMCDHLNAEAASNEKREPSPAFKCENCGEEAYFHGSFSAARYQQQHEQFQQKHKRCLPIYGGGCI